MTTAYGLPGSDVYSSYDRNLAGFQTLGLGVSISSLLILGVLAGEGCGWLALLVVGIAYARHKREIFSATTKPSNKWHWVVTGTVTDEIKENR